MKRKQKFVAVFHESNKYSSKVVLDECLYIFKKYKMQYCDRIQVPEGIDINKTSQLNNCDICHQWYFLDKGFYFLLYVCNRCHDLVMISMKLSDIAILNIKGAAFVALLVELTIVRP